MASYQVSMQMSISRKSLVLRCRSGFDSVTGRRAGEQLPYEVDQPLEVIAPSRHPERQTSCAEHDIITGAFLGKIPG
jgi:hypothetical protein